MRNFLQFNFTKFCISILRLYRCNAFELNENIPYKVRNHKVLQRRISKSIMFETESHLLFAFKSWSIVHEVTKKSTPHKYENVLYKVRNHETLQRKNNKTKLIPFFALEMWSIAYEATKNSKSFKYENVL